MNDKIGVEIGTMEGNPEKNVGKRAVIYARYSAGSKQDSATLKTQVSQCAERAKKDGFFVVDIYEDESKSAFKSGDQSRRTNYARMLEDAKAGKFDAVYVLDISRLSRQAPGSAMQVIETLLDSGVSLYSVMESLTPLDHRDSDGYDDVLWYLVLKANHMYSRRLSKRVKLSMEATFKASYWMGSIPYGYKTETVQVGDKARKKLTVYEPEARVIRQIFELYASGTRQTEICEILDKQGTPPRKGGRWLRTHVSKILGHNCYVGNHVYKQYREERTDDPNKPKRVVDKEQTLPCASIIQKDLWDRVQVKRAIMQKYMGARRMTRSVRPLAGLVVCGVCNSNFSPYVGYKKQHFLQCISIKGKNNRKGEPCGNPTIPNEEHLVDAIKSAMRTIFSMAVGISPMLVPKYKWNIKNPRANSSAGKPNSSALKQQVSAKLLTMEGARKAYEDSQAEIVDRRGQLDKEHEQLERESGKIQRQIDTLGKNLSTGALTGDALALMQEQLTKLADKRNACERRKSDIARIQLSLPTVPEFEKLWDWFVDQSSKLQDLHGAELRAALGDLGCQILVNPDGLCHISMRIPYLIDGELKVVVPSDPTQPYLVGMNGKTTLVHRRPISGKPKIACRANFNSTTQPARAPVIRLK
ncbi:MAG: recombinase family protein [Candidatus Riflebacteria bacterium]|nr:recombinase family protein [Candidatus Riflebacteria bacterium]